MNFEEYGEVINGEDTYEELARVLKAKQPIIIGWTDENGTHFDILFTPTAEKRGNNIQGGVRPATDLFVSIMRWGAFAFEVNEADTHPGYYEEKLGNRGPFGEATSAKLAELINGVRRKLHEMS